MIDASGNKYKIKDLIPAEGLLKEKMYAVLAVDENGDKKYLPIRDFDLELYQKAQRKLLESPLFSPYYEVRPGYNTNQARGYNYLRWKDFFNDRQLLCLGKLLQHIISIEDKAIREQMLCLFSSTLEYNNMFCSYKGEGTGAVRPIFSNHILKPERTPLENSVWGYSNSSGCFSGLFRTRLLKAKEYLDKPFEIIIDEKTSKCEKVVASNPLNPVICNSWDELSKAHHAALILNGDSSDLPIPDGAVDFVVTDPPYFDFIHYSELSDFFYAWLSPILKKDYSFFVPNTSGRKNEVQQTDATEFSKRLGHIFSECNRILKPSGKLVFSFHHSRADGWIAIANAIKQAGFYVNECFPVHAELMASTPKAGTKEPISLDAIIVCNKQYATSTEEASIKCAQSYIAEMEVYEKQLSKSDVFVVCASQCLSALVAENYSDAQKINMLQRVFESVLLAESDDG